MQDLAGKVAFVTGGASGIGYGMVQAFLREGMKVVVADRSRRHIEEVRGELQGSNAVHFVQVDVGDRDDLRRAADETERVFGAVDVLCNNAGIGNGGAVSDPDFDAWDRMMRVNLGGVVNGCKIIVPRMIERGEGGHVVNTASMAGIVPLPNEGGAYTTSKFAVRGLTESLRLTLAPHGIGVSCLCPGLTRSRIMEGAEDAPEQDEGERKVMARVGDPDALFNSMEGAMEPIEVGEAVVRGIRSNAPWILPHAEFRDEVAELFNEILESFPKDQQVSEGRLRFESGRRAMTEELRQLQARLGSSR